MVVNFCGSIVFGFRFQPGGKIVGNAKIGYQMVSFENNEDKNGNKYDDDPQIIGEADLKYFLSEQTSFNLFGGRSLSTSVTADNPDDVSSSYMNTYGGVGALGLGQRARSGGIVGGDRIRAQHAAEQAQARTGGDE